MKNNAGPVAGNKQKLSIALLTLLLIAGLFAIQFTHLQTRDRIAENKRRAALSMLEQLVSTGYDNDIYQDHHEIAVPETIHASGRTRIYLARLHDRVTTAVIMPVSFKGYGGNITMAVAINDDNAIAGIHILDHHETRGFGAEFHQDRSDWLTRFNGASLDSVKEKDWAIRADGGGFDGLSGATITSRSVIEQLRHVLDYYVKHKPGLHKP